MEAFHRDLTDEFPTLSDLADDPQGLTASPWAIDPVGTRDHVLMCMTRPPSQMVSQIRILALEHGLVLFNPQVVTVAQDVLTRATPEKPVMTICDGGLIVGPGYDEIAAALATLDKFNCFAILEASDQEYIQVGVGGGEVVGDDVPVGTYDLELRVGGPDDHYSHQTTDLDVIVRAFQCTAAGDDGWVDDLTWTRVVFD